MYRQEAREEYLRALKQGQKEYKLSIANGEDPYPAVLDDILEGRATDCVQDVGLVEIPAEKITGVKSAGRVTAFSAGFMPLLDEESEFGIKWMDLCEAHLTSGIRDPIICYEYLGNFYVQEGNKRVSVLRAMGSPRITGMVKRVVPEKSEHPRIRAYYEFLEFYKDSGLYLVQFRRPGDYAELMSYLGKEAGEKWDDRERRTFSSYFGYFREAFSQNAGQKLDMLPEEALLVWLQVHPFRDLGQMSTRELNKSVGALWEDIQAQSEPVEVRTDPLETETKTNVITRIISGTPTHQNVAFIHPMDADSSAWVKGHDVGRQQMEEALGNQVTVRSYFHADTPEQAESLMDQAVADGAEVVFTTTPNLSRPTLRAAVKYPKVRFLNCSVDTPYSSIRTYYSRIYEAKFITGAIAGAMANNDLIGYIGSSPIFGVPASINAFALGAQMTNPRAKVVLRWSCLKGAPQTDFLRDGIHVISNRDVPMQGKKYLDLCNYGTYAWDELGTPQPIGSPVWLWGKFYENVIRSIFAGSWDKDKDKDAPRAVNYWWGMDSGVIDVELSDNLPEGLKTLAQLLRSDIKSGALDPFKRKVVAQDGTVKNDGSAVLTPDELLHMDWLCDNVIGSIPQFDEIEPFARSIVRQLGVYRDSIPMEKEGTL